jgi:hypothetical protein
LIAEFNDVVGELEQSKSDASVGDEARLEVVKQLCELSRDARFQMGPPQYAEPDQLV